MLGFFLFKNYKCYNNVVTLMKKFNMETNIISIGNSKGIIIPAKLLKSNGFNNIVNIEFEKGKLVITPTKKPRENWNSLIKNEIEKNGQPNKLIPDFFEDEENFDWQW